MQLSGRKILIGVTGSIAAFKIPVLVRLFKKEGADVRIIMTPAACDFVTPLTLSTLSGYPVAIEPFDKLTGQWNSHIELGSWPDVFLLAPLSANTLAKIAAGIADNLLLTTYLAARCPVFFAPAMDLDMFMHPATQQNISKLQAFGNKLIEPREGELASGLCGAGRMEEPEEILNIIKVFFLNQKSFEGKRVLVTAGPTFEPIDPVRFIGNHSSGLMGFELAKEFAERGADVVLIAGPTSLSINSPRVKRIDITNADELFEVCKQQAADAEIVIMAAAVADYKPVAVASSKIKKSDNLQLTLVKTTDTLEYLGRNKKAGQLLVGFALETENETENAIAKLKNKNLDIIVLNSLSDEGAGFGSLTNKITIIDRFGNNVGYPLKPKKLVAADIANYLHRFMHPSLPINTTRE